MFAYSVSACFLFICRCVTASPFSFLDTGEPTFCLPFTTISRHFRQHDAAKLTIRSHPYNLCSMRINQTLRQVYARPNDAQVRFTLTSVNIFTQLLLHRPIFVCVKTVLDVNQRQNLRGEPRPRRNQPELVRRYVHR